MKFLVPDPDKAYITNQLLLPRKHIREAQIKAVLQFWTQGQESEFVQMWRETEDHLVVPREFIKSNEYTRWPFPFVDATPKVFRRVCIESDIIPRNEDQAAAMNAMAQNSCGILNLSCGKGKTVIALNLMAKLKVPTLVIVHNSSLITQWRNRINEHLRVEGGIGLVQKNEFDWDRPVALAMIHTLANKASLWPADFRRHWGLVIYDEVHHLAAPVFSRTAPLFYGKRYGLTATPDREDGRESVFKNHLGRIFYVDRSQDLIPRVYFMKMPTLVDTANQAVMEEVTDKMGQINLARLRNWLGRNEERNGILSMHVRRLMREGRRILALSHSVEHLELMHERFPDSGLCVGKVDQDERIQALENHQVVFATVQIAAEGLDEPRLDTLYVMTPFGSQNWIEQAMGRTQRERTGKQHPLVVVADDHNIPKCAKVCRKARTSFRSLGYDYRIIDWSQNPR